MIIGTNDLSVPCPLEKITPEVIDKVWKIIDLLGGIHTRDKGDQEVINALKHKYIYPVLLKELNDIT